MLRADCNPISWLAEDRRPGECRFFFYLFLVSCCHSFLVFRRIVIPINVVAVTYLKLGPGRHTGTVQYQYRTVESLTDGTSTRKERPWNAWVV